MSQLIKWKVVEVKADKRGRRVYRCPQCWEGKRHFEIYFLENLDTKEKLKMCEDHTEDFFASWEQQAKQDTAE